PDGSFSTNSNTRRIPVHRRRMGAQMVWICNWWYSFSHLALPCLAFAFSVHVITKTIMISRRRTTSASAAAGSTASPVPQHDTNAHFAAVHPGAGPVPAKSPPIHNPHSIHGLRTSYTHATMPSHKRRVVPRPPRSGPLDRSSTSSPVVSVADATPNGPESRRDIMDAGVNAWARILRMLAANTVWLALMAAGLSDHAALAYVAVAPPPRPPPPFGIPGVRFRRDSRLTLPVTATMPAQVVQKIDPLHSHLNGHVDDTTPAVHVAGPIHSWQNEVDPSVVSPDDVDGPRRRLLFAADTSADQVQHSLVRGCRM
ncbi:hypothetical protein BC828DRAFT_389374, partial [Blastocladiella britannica]